MSASIKNGLVRPKVLGSGLGLLEGPAWHAGSLYFVAVSRGLVWRWHDGTFVEHALTGGGPNGLAIDGFGEIWVAQNGGVRSPRPSTLAIDAGIQRIAVDGSVVSVESAAHSFDGPNDIAIGPDGAIWFTDPPFDAVDHSPLPGRVWRHDLASRQLKVVVEGMLFPNGLAFTPDGSELLVVETGRARILRYPLTGDGALGAPVVHAQLDHGEPDGICFDVDGRLFVANGPGGDLAVIEPDGTLSYLPLVGPELGERPVFATNCCFGGPDLRTLFVTLASGGRLLSLDTPFTGHRLPNHLNITPRS